MADRIAAAGHRVVADVYPNPAPAEPDMHYRDGLPALPPDRTVHNGGMGGVLQGLDIEGLVQLATARNATIVLPLAAGDYLRYQGNAFEIYGGDSFPPDQELM